MAIVEAVIAMARHMGVQRDGGGVESRQLLLEFLQAQGCHFFRGISPPSRCPCPIWNLCQPPGAQQAQRRCH